MFRPLEAEERVAREAQALIRDHYARLGIWSLYEVCKHIANPDDAQMVADQLRRLKAPSPNMNKAGNLPPRYGGLYSGGEMVGLIKAGKYLSPKRALAGELPYMNIHELVVADRSIYTEAVAQSLAFGRSVLEVHQNEPASVEVFALPEELAPYTATGFAIVQENSNSYDFDTTTSAPVHRLVRPNIRDGKLRVVKTT